MPACQQGNSILIAQPRRFVGGELGDLIIGKAKLNKDVPAVFAEPRRLAGDLGPGLGPLPGDVGGANASFARVIQLFEKVYRDEVLDRLDDLELSPDVLTL